LDELAFSSGAFFVVYSLIAEAPLKFAVCHFSCFASASFFARRGEAGGKADLGEASNRHCQRRTMALFTAPVDSAPCVATAQANQRRIVTSLLQFKKKSGPASGPQNWELCPVINARFCFRA
jgi:hypothetical protein